MPGTSVYTAKLVILGEVYANSVEIDGETAGEEPWLALGDLYWLLI